MYVIGENAVGQHDSRRVKPATSLPKGLARGNRRLFGIRCLMDTPLHMGHGMVCMCEKWDCNIKVMYGM